MIELDNIYLGDARELGKEIQDQSVDLIFTDLKGLGYTDNEISSAYCWVMDRFNGEDDTYFSEFPDKHSSTRRRTDK